MSNGNNRKIYFYMKQKSCTINFAYLDEADYALWLRLEYKFEDR